MIGDTGHPFLILWALGHTPSNTSTSKVFDLGWLPYHLPFPRIPEDVALIIYVRCTTHFGIDVPRRLAGHWKGILMHWEPDFSTGGERHR